jgi:rhodanese-related sulfurtransferase
MTIKKLLYFTLILSLAIFAACSSSSEPQEEPVDEFALVAEVGDVYYTEYPISVNITMDILFENLTDGDTSDDPFIIDWRGSDDYDARHIKDAENIALGDLVARVDDGTIPTDKTIVNVCYSGQTASVATATLNLLGYDAQNLKFGMCGVTDDTILVPGSDKWSTQIESDEYTLVDTGPGAPSTTYDFPDPDTGEKTAEDIIKANFSKVLEGWKKFSPDVIANRESYHIVNYWYVADYDDIGHIETAFQYTPKLSLKSDELLNTLPTDKPVIIYCWTGQTSAQVVAYLRVLGYDAYSMLYGVNGCSFSALPVGKPRYQAPDPSDKFKSVLEPAP